MDATVFVPGLRVHSELNARSHWAARNRRRREQADAVTCVLRLSLAGGAATALRAAPRLRVTMTRIYAGRGRAMDSDNLDGAFKFVRDAVAAWLGRDDGPDSGIDWHTRQERGETPGVGIRLEAIPAQAA
jgi:hypothetical protein